MAELKLLAQCDGIKEKFDEFMKEGDVKGVPGMFLNLNTMIFWTQCQLLTPAFYFNFKDAFYGGIEPISASGHRSIPHIGFLATPLLPCGRFDDPVKKYSGSDILGPANDTMTQAVNAFVHFGWIYSREQILFCDMQGLQYFLNSSLNSILCCSDVCWIGTRDRNGKMCLIDPPAHTCVTPADGLLYFGLKFVLITVSVTEKGWW